MSILQILNPGYEDKVELALFKLFHRIHVSSIVGPVVLPLLIVLGFGRTLPGSLKIWLVMMCCAALSGAFIYFGFQFMVHAESPDARVLQRWRRAFLIHIALAGFAWGGIALMFDPGHPVQNAALLVIYLGVMSAAVNTTAIHSLRAYFVSVVCSLLIVLPMIPQAFGEQSVTLQLMLVFYFLIIGNSARHSHQLVMKSVQLQFINNQLMQEKQLIAQTLERERIYRDLHDDVGAKLLGLAILAQRANQPQEADLARSALQDLRDVVSRSAHTASWLDNLLADLRSETSQRVQGAGIALDWSLSLSGQALLVSATAALNLSRILREAVTNVLRHACASRVSIDLMQHAKKLTLTIQDDGVGLPASGVRANRGMNSMRTRASALGGNIAWGAPSTGGCSVVIEISLAHIAPEANGATAA
jgi:signal transduction histidine kinase